MESSGTKIIKYFKHPQNAGVLTNPTSIGIAGNEDMGIRIMFYLKVNSGIIRDVSFQTRGCVTAIASSNALAELAKGERINECLLITPKWLAGFLGVPKEKFYCCELAVEAIRKGISNYKLTQRICR